ncbi:hypothetical protein GBSOP10_105818 [Armatimonadetes bacterium GBS]|jgi:predicted nucleic acid-binding protein|nr:hypothetical protein GBSOP10_105818 [Armatimonadetes bacterium GBS]
MKYVLDTDILIDRCRLSIIDAVIGSVCAARQGVLCTFNVRHYRCVSSLQTLQPYPKNL